MSEGEQKGRCRSEMTAAYGARGFKPNDSDLVTADALDRLAADVAAVKEMTREIALRVPSEFGQDACDVAVRVLEKDRDAAIRKRDEARAEVERLRAEVERLRMQLAVCGVLADCNTTDSLETNRRVHLDYDCAAVQSVIRAVEREISLRAEVEELKAMLEEQQTPAAPQPAAPPAGWLTEEERGVIVCAASELSAIGHHRPPDKEECLRLSAALRSVVKRHDENTPARAGSPPEQAAAGWLTEEERRVLRGHAKALHEQRCALDRGERTIGYSADPGSLKIEFDIISALLTRAGSPPSQTAPWWLTDEERRALSRAVRLLFSDDCDTPSAGTVQALLSRAGSPPVVVLPTVFARSLLGDELVALQQVKDSLDAAGVSWKEVSRGQDLK